MRTNVRAVLFGTVLPLVVGLAGLVLSLGVPGREPATWMRALGIGLIVVAGITIVLLLLQLRQPRLAYCDGRLLVWLHREGWRSRGKPSVGRSNRAATLCAS